MAPLGTTEHDNLFLGFALRWHDVECGSSAQFFNLNANIGVVPESAGGSLSGQSANTIKTTSGGKTTGIQISASAGAASSSFGGSASSAFGGASLSASASASSSSFSGSKQAGGSKQAYNY